MRSQAGAWERGGQRFVWEPLHVKVIQHTDQICRNRVALAALQLLGGPLQQLHITSSFQDFLVLERRPFRVKTCGLYHDPTCLPERRASWTMLEDFGLYGNHC